MVIISCILFAGLSPRKNINRYLSGYPVKKSLLSIINCLHCRSDLSLRNIEETEGAEIIEADLFCSTCSAVYPVIRGVPRFVSHEVSRKTDLHTGEKFAVSWKKFSRLDARYHQQFFDWLAPVTPADLKGKIVLEAGCGKGRHTAVVADSGAKQVVSVDIGDSVDIAYANAGHLPNVHIIQSDINAMPFSNVFDVAFSVGVLHHMEDPRSGFNAVSRLVKPGGTICVWLYGRENNGWIVNLINPLRHGVTSKVSGSVLSPIAVLMTIPLFIVAKFLVRPYAQLQSKNNWMPELFYQRYLAYIGEFDFKEIESIVFDHLVAPVAYYLRRSEIEAWFDNTERFSKPLLRWHNKNSWTACATVEPNKKESLAGITARV